MRRLGKPIFFTAKERRARQLGGGVKSALGFLAGLAFLAVVALGAGSFLAYKEATSPGPKNTATVILLEPGSSVGKIAMLLEEAGVIRHTELFKGAVRAKGVQNALKAGEYEIPAGASLLEVIDILVAGKSILHFFTAPEGLTTAQILNILRTDETLLGDVTLSPNEGQLLPETYGYTRGETRDAIVQRMILDQEKTLAELWENRQLGLPLSNKQEVVILASIVEKETGIAEERSRIAAVFINRLKRNIRLQSDPTIIYGLTKGEPLGRGLRQSELRGKTPYNTYVIDGLPPTPIANPGKASLEAVLNPADTNDLFFVADGTGGHVFAETLREHQRNVAQWRRIEREQKAGE